MRGSYKKRLNTRTSHDRWQDALRSFDAGKSTARDIRRSKQWKKYRRAWKQEHPFCSDPFGIHGTHAAMADDVHHIVPLHKAPELAFESTNTVSLCRGCHNRIEAMERKGEGTEGYFNGQRPA